MDEKEKLQKEIGQRLEEIIKRLNYRKNDVARILNIDPTTLSKILSGERKIQLDMLYKLYKVFNVNLNYIIAGEGYPFILEKSKCYLIGKKLKFLREENDYSVKEMFSLIPSLRSEKEYTMLENNEKEACENLIYEIAVIFGANPEWLKDLEDKVLFSQEFYAIRKDDLIKKFKYIAKEIENKTLGTFSLNLTKGFISNDKLRIAVVAEPDVAFIPGHNGGIAFVDEQEYNTKYWFDEHHKICYLKDFFLDTAKNISFSVISDEDFDAFIEAKHSLSYILKKIKIIKYMHKYIAWDIEDKRITKEVVARGKNSEIYNVLNLMHTLSQC